MAAPAANGDGTEADRGEERSPRLGFIDGLRVVAGLLALNCLLSYFITGHGVLWGHRPWWSRPSALAAKLRSPVVLTDAQLRAYDGSDESRPIYVAVNGSIFDVTAGRRIYGPAGPYHVFAGRDAARAYITGCFHDDSIPDYRGAEWTFVPHDVPRFDRTADEDLSDRMREYRYEMLGRALEEAEATLEHWQKVFRGHTGKDYFRVGRVQRDWQQLASTPVLPLCAPAERKRPQSLLDKASTPDEMDRKRQRVRRGKMYRKQFGAFHIAVGGEEGEEKSHGEL